MFHARLAGAQNAIGNRATPGVVYGWKGFNKLATYLSRRRRLLAQIDSAMVCPRSTEAPAFSRRCNRLIIAVIAPVSAPRLRHLGSETFLIQYVVVGGG